MVRGKTDVQIMEVMKTMEGMKPHHLMLLYSALDQDANGNLDRAEVTKLLAQILGEAATPELLSTAFAEMDGDDSGYVDFAEFAAFFGIDASNASF